MANEPNPNPNPPTPEGGGLNPGSGEGQPNPGGQPAPTPPPPAAPAPTPDSGEKIFTQADLDRIVRERLRDEQARADRRIEDERKKAEQDKLREQGEFKTLAEQREKELEQLRADNKRKDREALCIKIAAEEKLPASLALRLVGDDETAIRDDAKKVFAEIAAPIAPNAEGGQRNNGGAGGLYDQIREAKKKELGQAQPPTLEETMRLTPPAHAR